jgi:Zn-finger nucleic acid-binding protein
MKCPQCESNLTIAERQGVEIDYCPNCRGVWLDRGELDKIIERSDAYEPHRAQEQPRGEYRDGYRDQHPPRKKSFWHELFD